MRIGKVSESILKRSVLKQIKQNRDEIVSGAGIGEDCAIFALSEGLLASCMQEAAVAVEAAVDTAPDSMGEELPPGTGEVVIPIGHLFQRCANNLSVQGAEPIAALLTLLLPEYIEEPQLKKLMAEAERAAETLGMTIAGGQSRVSKAVRCPYAVITGYGRILPHAESVLKPGQDIVVTKWLGLEGTALLAQHHKEQLLTRYPAYLVREAASFDRYLSIRPEAELAWRHGATAMHDASYGGIFAALWELAERVGTGLTVDLPRLPLRQETVEVCECCQANPYELLSGGALVLTCEDGLAMVDAMAQAGIPATVVGRLTEGKDRILCNEDEVRYMDRPRSDEIYTHL